MTILYEHDAALSHVTPPGHPERVDRIKAIRSALSASAFDALDRREAPVADRAEVLRCHPERYVARIEAAIPESGYRPLDADTHVSPGSLEAALRAVGGIAAAVDAVLAGEDRTAFVAMRPPGHHAEAETPMGFCLFGTAAIGAKRALDHHGLSRVAVLDFDVHHGNGTQALLWDEARSLFVSSHQMPLWPGTGAAHETGAHDNVINAPLPPMSGGTEMRRAWADQILPAVDDFAPELIIISAGFDAHAADPLANLNWVEEDFVWLTRAIREVADAHAGGRVVSTLEGGYDLDALAASTAAHVAALME
ncbi:histone deacetylase family protein [Alphaproteobacteria bacterium GH1-50]|uniref:Histone deacetylase family protein n=1 Tax=Kangsaoukella pontilimi TaxID=2691042 RepID=A0A7C9J3S0_9RHOB|nr:histone deacetylase family protein [Kangsaoukella pontilimi]MXQ08361.1 histone deacetylase family protein [Kangsaoukella pontilimi]